MSRCTFYLLSLSGSVSDFNASISTIPNSPVYIGKVHRWVAPPTSYSTDPLTTTTWNVFLFFAGSVELPDETKASVEAEWRLEADAPPPMLAASTTTNQRFAHPRPEDIPPLTGRWEHPHAPEPASHLEMDYSPELQAWVRLFGAREGKTAVSMFNLLAYHDGKREEYFKYVQEFTASVGKAVGAEATVFGQVASCSSTPDGKKEWEDTALVHYPSIYHFADLLGNEEYQKLDVKYKVGNVKDNPILCLTEL